MDDVLRPLFDAFVAHAYLVVFVGALIDATGLPFPGRLLLAGAGAYAAAGNASLGAFIALAALGAMLADQLWFWTATRGSAWLMDVYCRLTRRPAGCVDSSLTGLVRSGPLTPYLLETIADDVRSAGHPSHVEVRVSPDGDSGLLASARAAIARLDERAARRRRGGWAGPSRSTRRTTAA